MNNDPDDQTPLLSIGFRPFFLAAGIYAVLAMLAWVGWLALHSVNALVLTPTIAVPAHLWHGHEILFGYAAAVISGFMLTAVPGWTGARRVAGLALVVLVTVWFAGRVAVWFSAFLPAGAIAVLDMAFLPMIAGTVALALIKRPAPQNVIFLALLAVLIVANGAVHVEWLGWTEDTASWGLAVGVIDTTLMIVILGGRIIPSFTRNALMRQGKEQPMPQTFGLLDKASIASAAAVLVCYLSSAPAAVTGSVAAIAAAANLARLSFWCWRSTLGEPILWSLHLAYLWIPAGYGAIAASFLGGWLSHSAALHFLAIGAIGGMTLAMMTRAPLGHTGRPLVVVLPIAVSYLLIALAALLRGLVLDTFPASYFTIVFVAGGLWVAGFAIYVFVYAPILIGPSLKDASSG